MIVVLLLILATFAFAASFLVQRFGDDYCFALMFLAFGFCGVAAAIEFGANNKAWREGYKCAQSGGELVESGSSYKCVRAER